MSSLAAAPSLRPSPGRPDSDVIPSYYQSDLPGKEYLPSGDDDGNDNGDKRSNYLDPPPKPDQRPARHRTTSSASSSSLYSTPTTPPAIDAPFNPSSFGTDLPLSSPSSPSAAHRRRPSNSATDPDRRMAIVQTDTARFLPLSLDAVAQHRHGDAPRDDASSTGKHPGRVHDVAATDAPASSSFSSVTIPPHPRSHHPTSAPPTPRDRDALPASDSSSSSSSLRTIPASSSTVADGHARSMSDAATITAVRHRASNKNVRAHHASDSAGHQLQVDASTSGSSHSGSSSSRPRTPEDVPQGTSGRVALPHSAQEASNPKRRFVRYEPGVHSTAGPLPPPPRATINIDTSSPPPPRPPRLRSPSPMIRQGGDLSTPPSIADILSSKASSSSLSRLNAEHGDKGLATVTEGSVTRFPLSAPQHHAERSSHHVREGAFQPSRIMNSSPARSSQLNETIRLVSSNTTNGASSASLLDIEPPPPTIAPSSGAAVDGLPLLSDPSTLPVRPDVRRDPSWVSVQIPSDSPSEYSSPDPTDVPTITTESPASFSPEPLDDSPSSTEDDHHYHNHDPRHLSTELPPSLLRSRKEGGSPLRPTAPAMTTYISAQPALGTLSDEKRYSSLPRTPSYASSNSTRPSRTPSPPPPPRRQPPRQKIRAMWPDAMWCRDVYTIRNQFERAQAYAHKINELATYDCGLEDWVGATRSRARNSTGRTLPNASSRAVSIQQPLRKVSRSSFSSEATFPLRPDAYVATDLTTRSTEDLDLSTSPPPALPYPALATSPLSVTTTMTASNSSLIAAPHNRLSFVAAQQAARALPGSGKPGTGFFASIGRNHSTRKDGRMLPPPNKLVKTSPTGSSSPSSPLVTMSQPPPPRPMMGTQTVPGGPRAAPGRVARSQTLMLPPSPSTGGGSASDIASSPSSSRSSQPRRRSNTLKRPSLFGSGGGSSREGGNGVSGPRMPHNAALAADFQRQVDKLAELVPHADRDVLAGYLRRAGQDILAIGQYLEDEKSGTLRRD